MLYNLVVDHLKYKILLLNIISLTLPSMSPILLTSVKLWGFQYVKNEDPCGGHKKVYVEMYVFVIKA